MHEGITRLNLRADGFAREDSTNLVARKPPECAEPVKWQKAQNQQCRATLAAASC
jgi:hypothetical protein